MSSATLEKSAMHLNLDRSAWKLVRFGDVAVKQNESVDRQTTELKRYIAGEHMRSEDLHLREWGEVGEDYLGPAFTRKFVEGDILYGSRRTYLRKVAVAHFDGITANTTFVIKANEELIVKELLPFVMLSEGFTQHSIRNSKGSVNPYINWKDIANYEFLLPPKDQQAKLAELLWAGDQNIQRLRDCTTSSDFIQKVVRKKLLDYGYSSRSRDLPPGWEKVRMRDLATVQSGATPARSHPEYYREGTIPWVKTLDLRNGDIWETEEKITEEALAASSCKIRPVGTVLVAMYGGFNQIGRTGILRVPAATNQALAAIMPDDEERVLPEFLLYLLNAKVDYWKRVAISSRKDPNITKSDVEIFPIPLPPVEAQRAIIKEISRTLKLEREVTIAQNSSAQLLKSLINQIF